MLDDKNDNKSLPGRRASGGIVPKKTQSNEINSTSSKSGSLKPIQQNNAEIKRTKSVSSPEKNPLDKSEKSKEDTTYMSSTSSVKKRDIKSVSKNVSPKRKLKDSAAKKVSWKKNAVEVVEVESFKTYNYQMVNNVEQTPKKKDETHCNCSIY